MKKINLEEQFDKEVKELRNNMQIFLTKWQTDYNKNHNKIVEESVFEAIEGAHEIIDNAYL